MSGTPYRKYNPYNVHWVYSVRTRSLSEDGRQCEGIFWG